MNGLTYTKVGDYYIPNLVLKEQPDTPIGRYGRMSEYFTSRDPERNAVPLHWFFFANHRFAFGIH